MSLALMTSEQCLHCNDASKYTNSQLFISSKPLIMYMICLKDVWIAYQVQHTAAFTHEEHTTIRQNILDTPVS